MSRCDLKFDSKSISNWAHEVIAKLCFCFIVFSFIFLAYLQIESGALSGPVCDDDDDDDPIAFQY